jgi:hypothetical protein
VSARQLTATLVPLVTALVFVGPAQAQVPFGVGDDGAVIADPSLLTSAHNVLGARWVRYMVRKGDEAQYEQTIRHADALGYKIIVNLRDNRGGNPRLFPAYVKRMVRRWPQMDAVGVLNEPEFTRSPSPCEYLKLYKRAREAARSVRPITVLFGDFSPSAWSYIAEFKLCSKSAWPRKIDGIALHPYMQGDPLRPNGGWKTRQFTYSDAWIGIGELPRFRRVFRKMGISAPIWITEFGYLHEYVTDEEAALWWPRAIQQAARVGARVIIAHGFRTYGSHRDWNSPLGPEAQTALANR